MTFNEKKKKGNKKKTTIFLKKLFMNFLQSDGQFYVSVSCNAMMNFFSSQII